MKKPLLRLFALLCVFTLVAAACGSDDETSSTTTTADDSASSTTEGDGTTTTGDGAAAPAGEFDAVPLTIGRVLPETGALAFLGAPMIEGVNLAIEDINAEGGNATLLEADSATDPDVATEAVNRLLGEGAEVIVGAAASGVSESFIKTLSDSEIPQCSGSNTSPSFTANPDADFYFRTVPPDNAVAPIIADVVTAAGATKVEIVARADDYGDGLSTLIAEELDALGAESEITTYNPDAPSADDVVGSIESYGGDAVVFVTFDEGIPIIQGAIEAGISADTMYGADGIFFPGLAADVNDADQSVMDGFTLIGATGTAEFNERLTVLTDGNLIYGGQTYDCVIILALAAQAAGSADGAAINAEVTNVTTGGTVCTSFGECAGLLAAGEDIDYDGQSGTIELDDVGDPQTATYGIAAFSGGVLEPIDSQTVDLSQID